MLKVTYPTGEALVSDLLTPADVARYVEAGCTVEEVEPATEPVSEDPAPSKGKRRAAATE